jgi:hypothetical protein
MKNNLGTLVKSLALAASVALPAKAALIYETDGNYNNLGNGQLGWQYKVENTDLGNITSIMLNDLYSLNQPASSSLPTFWTMSASDADNDHLWEIILTANQPLGYIPQNGSRVFGFNTDYDNVNVTINTGHRDGSVTYQLEPGIWYDASDAGLIGPTGVVVVPEPSTAIAGVLVLGFAAFHYLSNRRQENKQVK